MFHFIFFSIHILSSPHFVSYLNARLTLISFLSTLHYSNRGEYATEAGAYIAYCVPSPNSTIFTLSSYSARLEQELDENSDMAAPFDPDDPFKLN